MLPTTLEIPDHLAAVLTFDGELTARDRALLFAVSWYASRHPSSDGDNVMVPDLPLRRALGDMRRPDAQREFARYERLSRSVMHGDERIPDLQDDVPVPNVDPGMRRVTIGGSREWQVDERIRRSFELLDGDHVLELPLRILADARSRYTLPLMLRLLAWGAGQYPTKWRRRETEDVVVLRIPIDTFRREIGADPKAAPSNLIRHDVEPALGEIRSFTDLECDIQPVLAPSIRKGGGRVIAVDVLTDRIQPRIARIAAKPSATVLPFGRGGIDVPEPALDFD